MKDNETSAEVRRLKAELAEKEQLIEAAAARRPWTVIAWSAGIGAVIGFAIGFVF